MTEKERFVIKLNKHLENIRHAQDALSLYERIFIKSQQYPIEMEKINLAPAFFSTVHNSLITEFLSITMKLYDSDANTENLRKVINFAQVNTKIFHEKKTLRFPILSANNSNIFTDQYIDSFNSTHKNKYIEKTADQIREIRTFNTKIYCKIKLFECAFTKKTSMLIDLKTWRDKYYMHNDRKAFLEQNDLPKLPLKNIKDLLEFAYKVCNDLYLNLTDTNNAPNSMNIDDFDILIKHINLPS